MKKLLLVVILLSSCGGGSSPPSTAPADCEAFVAENYCPAVVACETSVSQDYCVAAAKTALDCAAAVGESSTLPACKADLAASPCGVLVDSSGNVTLPASCSGVFRLM